MSHMLNTDTWEYRLSQNTREYDGMSAWVANPDMTEVQGHPTSHWDRVQDGVVRLKTAAEIAAADVVPLDTAQSAAYKLLKRRVSLLLTSAYPPERVASLVEILDDAVSNGLTNRAAHIRSKGIWTMAVFEFYTDHTAAIYALTSSDDVAAYEWDLADILEVDPKISVSTALAIKD